jgi:hypothetical protein
MRYIFTLFCATVGTLLLACLVNFKLDPFGVWHSYAEAEKASPALRFRPGTDSDPRFAKPLQVLRLKPKTIIVGSSRVRDGMDPSILDGLAPAPIMNYGVAGMRAKEGARFIRHAIDVAGVSCVVWGLDFFGFNDLQMDEMGSDGFGILGDSMRAKDLARLLIAWPTALLSADVVKGTGSTLPNGFNLAPATPPDQIIESIMRNAVGFAQVPFLYGKFASFEKHMEEFEAVLAYAQVKGVKVFLYTSPLHALVTEAIFLAGSENMFFAWKAKVAELARKYGAPLYDCMEYNQITASGGAEAAKYFFDGAHFTPLVSRMILSRFFPVSSERPAAFAPQLSPGRSDAGRKKLEMAREAYIQANPELVGELAKRLAPSSESK